MDVKFKLTVITASMHAGGAERVISQLLHFWDKEGFELSLILLDKEEKFYSIPESVRVFEIGRQSGNRIFDKIDRYKQVRKIVGSIRPNVVLSLPEEIGIYVLWALRHTKIPVVVSERNDPHRMPTKKITRIMRQLMYPKAKGLIFQTEAAAAFFGNKIVRKSIVLPNPLDLSRIPDIWTGERDKVIVSAGRLEPQKNFRLLIEAFSVFYRTHNDYKLKIYGEGSQRRVLEELIDRKGLSGAAQLPGVSDTLLDDIKKASVFVLSSDHEGVPNVLIEAMALGIPSVSTDCAPGGAATVITPDTCGALVTVNDPAALSAAISSFADNGVDVKRLIDTADIIKNRYSSETVGRAWSEYLKSVAG